MSAAGGLAGGTATGQLWHPPPLRKQGRWRVQLDDNVKLKFDFDGFDGQHDYQVTPQPRDG